VFIVDEAHVPARMTSTSVERLRVTVLVTVMNAASVLGRVWPRGSCATAAKAEPPPLEDSALLQSKPGERLRSFRAGPDQWERARALRAQNWTVEAIGRAISFTPKSMRRLLKRDTPPPQEYVQLRRVPRFVQPFLPYLVQRCADGCQNGRQLTREIEQLG
jgi:hypothetical protein